MFGAVKKVAHGLTGGLLQGPKAFSVNDLAFKDKNYDANKAKIGGFIDRFSNTGVDQLSPGQADVFRQGQQSLVGQLQGRVAGNAPSVAEAQLMAGREDNIKAMMAQAGSTPGASAGLLARNLARGVQETNQATNQQMAQLRAGEQMAAEQTLAQTLGGARGQDLGAQAQKDQLAAQYMQMGLTLDQAQFQAQQDLEKLKMGAFTAHQEGAQKHKAGLISAGASMGSSLITG